MSTGKRYDGPVRVGMTFQASSGATLKVTAAAMATETVESLRNGWWPVRPADDDVAGWALFVPEMALPETTCTKEFVAGEAWAFATMAETASAGVVVQEISGGARVKWLAGHRKGETDRVTSEPWLKKCVRLFPAPDAQQAASAARQLAPRWKDHGPNSGICRWCPDGSRTPASLGDGNWMACDACAAKRGAFAPPPAKERRLAPGWTREAVSYCMATGKRSACQGPSHGACYSNNNGDGSCEASAELMGVFVAPYDPDDLIRRYGPTPPKTDAAPRCDHTKSAKCVEPGGCASVRALREASELLAQNPKAAPGKWIKGVTMIEISTVLGPTPYLGLAPQELLESIGWREVTTGNASGPAEKLPRCEYLKRAHEGTPVERVMMFEGFPRRMFACDACYLFNEASGPRSPVTADPRPPVRLGTVPQVFGNFVGIWGSRGMR